MIPPLDRCSRRALLKGATSSLLLPFLPSLSWADDPGAPTPLPPKRWAAIIFGMGVHADHWWAKGEGAAMELSSSLTPLEPHRGRFSVFDGLHLFDTPAEAGGGPHTPYFSNLLCGARVPSRAPFVMAQSCDQLLARTIGRDCAVPSLNLSCEQAPFGLANGVPGVISNTISWSSPINAVVPQASPREAFDELFDVKGLASEKSLLDCLQGELERLQGKLSPADQRKLDEFTDSVRDLERRIDRVSAPPADGWRPSLTEPDMLRPAQNLEQAMKLPLGVRHKLMLNILALAFRMDKTRVATLVLENDGSYIPMGFVPGTSANNGLHTLAHHAMVPDLLSDYKLTNHYHVSLLAGLMEKMQAVDEGGSTLLDSSMILFGSNIGENHNGTNVPLILAGGGGGSLKLGKSLAFTKTEDRRLCNLHLTMLQRMGVTVDGKPIEKFGTSLKPLEGI